MDDLGRVYLVIAIVAFIVAMIGYWILSKKGPRGAVLGTAAMIYFAGMSLPPGNRRELHLIKGMLQLTGFAGGILGVVDIIFRRPQSQQAEYVAVELVNPGGSEKPPAMERCPRCNSFVARTSDGVCPSCRQSLNDRTVT